MDPVLIVQIELYESGTYSAGLELMMGNDYLLINLYIDVTGCTFSSFLCSPYLKIFYNISGIYSSKAVLPYRF